jgi:MoaA/NifB/PqqE/SkfB family radical SAM enzyme
MQELAGKKRKIPAYLSIISSSCPARCIFCNEKSRTPLFHFSLSQAEALSVVSYPQKSRAEFGRIAGFKRQGRAVIIKIPELR